MCESKTNSRNDIFIYCHWFFRGKVQRAYSSVGRRLGLAFTLFRLNFDDNFSNSPNFVSLKFSNLTNRKNIISKKVLLWLFAILPLFIFGNDFSIGQQKIQNPPNSELVENADSPFSKSISFQQILQKQLPKNLFQVFYQSEFSEIAQHFFEIWKPTFLQISIQYLDFSKIQIIHSFQNFLPRRDLPELFSF